MGLDDIVNFEIYFFKVFCGKKTNFHVVKVFMRKFIAHVMLVFVKHVASSLTLVEIVLNISLGFAGMIGL